MAIFYDAGTEKHEIGEILSGNPCNDLTLTRI